MNHNDNRSFPIPFFLWGENIPTIRSLRSLFSFDQFRDALQKFAYKIAVDALTNLQGDIRIVVYGGRISLVETNRHTIVFYATHISYGEHDARRWENSWSFDVEEKLYLTSNHRTKISYYALEGEEKEVVEKITQFIDKIMADAAVKPVPRFTLTKITSNSNQES